MPPKKRISKHVPNNTPSTSTEIPVFAELAQQFEIELCWCIQQLQSALRLGKLNPKQTQDHTKALNTLMSNSAPMLKKRQVMRLAFGDYRAKMVEEDKKNSSVNTKLKIAKGVSSAKSVFQKKSNHVAISDSSFKFNFLNPSDNITALTVDLKLKDNVDKNNDMFHFAPSGNSFRFNFNSEDKR